MSTFRLAAFFAFVLSAPVLAQPADHPLGEHPAVLVKRLSEKQSYDYASQFYPHPAWLYLSSEAPRPMADHPAVVVFRRSHEERQPSAGAAQPRPAQAASDSADHE